MVCITTPAIPSCLVACFSDPYSHFKISNFYSPSILYIFNSYTTAARDFADIYTQSPRAAGLRAAGVYVSEFPSSCGISDIYHLGHTHLIGEELMRTYF